MTEDANRPSRGRQSKVARLIEQYDLGTIGEEMARRWTAEDERSSLRELADYFNRAVLRAALEQEGARLLDGEVENTYRLLTADDIGRAERMRIRRRLEREGVDVDALLDQFVTYQTIRTYLKKYQDAEYSPAETDPLEREIENVQRLRGRVDTVTSGKLEQLSDSGELRLGDFQTLIDVRVVCNDCNTQYDVVDLLRAGGCDCPE